MVVQIVYYNDKSKHKNPQWRASSWQTLNGLVCILGTRPTSRAHSTRHINIKECLRDRPLTEKNYTYVLKRNSVSLRKHFLSILNQWKLPETNPALAVSRWRFFVHMVVQIVYILEHKIKHRSPQWRVLSLSYLLQSPTVIGHHMHWQYVLNLWSYSVIQGELSSV
jgi:hypothetical protein